jgi:hypothetical protein
MIFQGYRRNILSGGYNAGIAWNHPEYSQEQRFTHFDIAHDIPCGLS